jgi:hypothetical protein
MRATTIPRRTRAMVEKSLGSSAMSSGLAGSPRRSVSWTSMQAHQPTVAMR